MITNEQRRFMDQWREQKEGPKWKFYLLFTIAWTIVSFLVIFFLMILFTQFLRTGGPNLIYMVLIISIITGFLSTHFTYTTNERKFNKIMHKIKENMN